jgi:hypothetical protein
VHFTKRQRAFRSEKKVRNNPRRQRRYGGGRAYSLITAQLDIPVFIDGMTALNFIEDPKTVRRFHFVSKRTLLISEAQARLETINNWVAVAGIRTRDALTEILDAGGKLSTLQASYERAVPEVAK